MQSKVVYVMIAGLAVGMLSTVSPKAMANGGYFKVLAPTCAIPERSGMSSRTIETTTSFPVVVERTNSYPVVIERTGALSSTGTLTTLVEGTSLMPAMLERTSVAKPHKFPMSFGVWP